MLAEFRDFVKTFNIGEHFSIGKIDGSKNKSIGIYGDTNGVRVEAIGKLSSYDRTNIRILIHWTKNLKETEEAARTLYSALRNLNDFTMTDTHVQILDLLQGEPTFVGTDENGVYEYVITLTLYYRR